MIFQNDNEAMTLLERGGYLIHRGVGLVIKHRKGTQDEEAAIRFLCEEYDYSWERESNPEESNEPPDVPYNEDSMPHLGDREELSQ